MNTNSFITTSVNKKTADKKWVVFNAQGCRVGRLATMVAVYLRGKHKPNFTPHADCGDNVIVINAKRVTFTGKKWEKKNYIRHTGYPGGQRTLTAQQVHQKSGIRIMEKAIKGMLPKNRLGATLFRNLYVYPGDTHPHEAQKPQLVDL